MGKIIKHTREEMFSIIEEWELSGMNKKQFCAQKGIGEWIFYYWVKQFKSYREEAACGFVPMKAKFSQAHTKAISVLYPNGVRVELPETVPMNQVLALVHLA